MDPEKVEVSKAPEAPEATVRIKKVPLIECFGPTIQGEGIVIGQQTYFLRFGLCDYKCVMCDSMHAVDPASVKKFGKYLTPQEIVNELESIHVRNSTNWVTFSGGNPCIHDLSEVVRILKSIGWFIHVETQGTKHPEWLKDVNLVTISPKGPGMGEVTNINELDEFMDFVYDNEIVYTMKIVVFDQRDLDFAAEIFSRYKHKGQIHYDYCFLSLGNTSPPNKEGDSDADELALQQSLLTQYKTLYEDISTHPILSRVKFLPQWHLFVWGNKKGH